jgi:hypothetical protein
MRTTLATLGISGILAWFCCAQESGTPVASPATVSNHAAPGIPKADPAAYYATLNRRVIESHTQFELLNQLAKEHSKRAEDASRDQVRHQWESELAKELSDRASAILSLLNSTSKERLAFEQAHPDLAASVLPDSVTGATNGPNPDAIAFLGALAERRTAVQQEITAATEAGTLYALQLATNSPSSDPWKLYSLIQDNSYSMKQLQRELFDLELKNLEFRALRKY